MARWVKIPKTYKTPKDRMDIPQIFQKDFEFNADTAQIFIPVSPTLFQVQCVNGLAIFVDEEGKKIIKGESNIING